MYREGRDFKTVISFLLFATAAVVECLLLILKEKELLVQERLELFMSRPAYLRFEFDHCSLPIAPHPLAEDAKKR